ncbi:hypothetical protein [Crossiella sp. NPDC003009]
MNRDADLLWVYSPRDREKHGYRGVTDVGSLADGTKALCGTEFRQGLHVVQPLGAPCNRCLLTGIQLGVIRI